MGRGNLNRGYKMLIYIVFYVFINAMEYVLEYLRVVCRFE